MTLILNGTDGLSDVDGSASTPAIRGTDPNTGIFFPAADTIAFAEGGAEAMRIDSSGNVAIGRTTANNKLDIGSSFTSQSSTGINTSAKQIRIGSGEAGILFTTDINTSGVSSGTQTSSAQVGYVYFDGTNPTDFVIGTGTQTVASNVRFYNGNTERMRIDSSGNVKLSTASTSILNSSGNKILNQTGSVLQVVQTSYSGTQTVVSASTYTDLTGLSASITPSSTSNKILIIFTCYAYVVSNANGANIRIVDGSNNVLFAPPQDSGGPFGFYISGADGSFPQFGTVHSNQYLWSPNTTSSVTVKLQGRPYSAGIGSAYFNPTSSNTNGTANIILMEIAG